MNKIRTQGLILLTLIFFLSGCNSCLVCKKSKQKTKQKYSKEEVSKIKKKIRIINQFKNTPLFEKWQYNCGETIRQLYCYKDMLLVETMSKKLLALDSKTGFPKWLYTLNGSMNYKPIILKNKLYVLCLGQIHILDKNTGGLLVKKELEFVPSSPMYIDHYIYLAGWDTFLYALDKNTGDKKWRYRTDGHVHGKITSLDNILFFADTDKKVYAIDAQTGYSKKDWADGGCYKTRGSNTSGVVVEFMPENLYIGSNDYNLYCLNRVRGNLRWKFESGGIIRKNPILIEDTIYVFSTLSDKDIMFYAVNNENGTLRWSLQDALSIFFTGKNYMWITSKNKKLISVKNKKIKVFNFDSFDIFASNLESSYGYAATKEGLIFCVGEK